MGRVGFDTLFKLAIASLIVGFAMATLGLRPRDIVEWITSAGAGLIDGIGPLASDAIGYIAIGAVIVVPVWLARRLWRGATRERGDARSDRQ